MSHKTLELLPEPKLDAWTLVSDAIFEHDPSHVFVLFSGGNDSKVLAHWAKRQLGHRLNAAVFVDTGVALPGVRDFAEEFCDRYEIPFLVYETPYSEFVDMCRQHGMPGPGAHKYPYRRLKERRFDQVVAEHKTHRYDRVLFLSGARRAESQTRTRSAIPSDRDGCQVWVNPLVDWTHAEMRAYSLKYDLPTSDVAALMHRSGECNCGAFAAPGEREMLMSLYPAWFEEKVAWIERELDGHPYAKWGTRRPGGERFVGRACHCESQLELTA